LKNIYLQIVLCFIFGCAAVRAQDFKRFEFYPFAGYTASGKVSLENEEGAGFDIHVDGSYSLGADLGVNINELDTIEASWQRQFTDGRVPAGVYDPDC